MRGQSGAIPIVVHRFRESYISVLDNCNINTDISKVKKTNCDHDWRTDTLGREITGTAGGMFTFIEIARERKKVAITRASEEQWMTHRATFSCRHCTDDQTPLPCFVTTIQVHPLQSTIQLSCYCQPQGWIVDEVRHTRVFLSDGTDSSLPCCRWPSAQDMGHITEQSGTRRRYSVRFTDLCLL
jgi:hypothetical protein